MIRKLSPLVGMMTFALVFATGAMAQQTASNDSPNKPGGASAFQPPIIAGDAAKPGGASTTQPRIIAGDAAKPGGASTTQPANH